MGYRTGCWRGGCLMIVAAIVAGSACCPFHRERERVAGAAAEPGVVPPAPALPGGGTTASVAAATATASSHGVDLTEPGGARQLVVEAVTIDTRDAAVQCQLPPAGSEPTQLVKDFLPPHQRRSLPPGGEPSDMIPGRLLDTPRTVPGAQWPGIGQTSWVPPDPTLAVGPTHIVTTVNQSIAFYTRDGLLEYSNYLNSHGDPGFFEPVGASTFTFDPKCFYDHLAQRFVVVAPEVYSDLGEAWITIGVSDDSNPHGQWHLYRTDAVVRVGDVTYWWDYPGFGYDGQRYYVCGNLFGLNQSGWAGVGFRLFDKADMLNGEPVSTWTLRDGSAASAQAAQHFGDNPAPFFVSVANQSSLRVQAITFEIFDPAPELHTWLVSVPSFTGPSDAPVPGGANPIALIDARIMNAVWRDGYLYATHHVNSSDKNVARWYRMNTTTWPSSGGVILTQVGEVDPGSDTHSWFPAISANRLGDVGLVCGTSSASKSVTVNVTGRTVADPGGTMGTLTPIKVATVYGGGRWGDYYDIAVDPLDDQTFWVIGEYPHSMGWATWIGHFEVTTFTLDYVDHFVDCLAGPGVVCSASCRNADLDGDNDVDMSDFAALLQVFTGPAS